MTGTIGDVAPGFDACMSGLFEVIGSWKFDTSVVRSPYLVSAAGRTQRCESDNRTQGAVRLACVMTDRHIAPDGAAWGLCRQTLQNPLGSQHPVLKPAQADDPAAIRRADRAAIRIRLGWDAAHQRDKADRLALP